MTLPKVRLLKNIEAEGELLPAGTLCEVEQSYPARDDQPAMLDLVEPESETLFWVFADDVEAVES